MLFICYTKCSTCKKAKDWLDNNNISYTFREIKEDNPNKEELKQWLSLSGQDIGKFWNTSGMGYRSLDIKNKRPHMSVDEQLELMATDGMLVKRPILVTDKTVLTGFKQTTWEDALL